MTPDPEAQPRPELYEPPRPEDRRPNPRGRATPQEIDRYLRELRERLGIGDDRETSAAAVAEFATTAELALGGQTDQEQHSGQGDVK